MTLNRQDGQNRFPGNRSLKIFTGGRGCALRHQSLWHRLLASPVLILCEVFGGLQVPNRPNKRPKIPYIEEAKMIEGIVYGTPIKSPEDHHHQFATLVNPSPTSPELG